MGRLKEGWADFRQDLVAHVDKTQKNEQNFRALCQLLLTGMLLCAIAALMHFPVYQETPARPLLILPVGFLAVFALCMICSRLVRPHATIFLYVAEILLFIGCAAADVIYFGDRPAVLFMVALLILPLLIMDTPWHLVMLIFLCMGAGLYAILNTQTQPLLLMNVRRLIPAALISCMLSLKIVIARLHAVRSEDMALSHAEHDPLTGVYNRGGGTFLISSCIKQQLAGTYIICDIDNFKHVNDTFGHKKGDIVLQSVAQALKRSFKSTDVVMRMGGDEFIVYSVGMVDENVSESRLNLVRSKIHQILLDPSTGEHVTISMGCVVNDGSYPTYNSLYQAADQMLYRTKENGKDGFMISSKPYKE